MKKVFLFGLCMLMVILLSACMRISQTNPPNQNSGGVQIDAQSAPAEISDLTAVSSRQATSPSSLPRRDPAREVIQAFVQAVSSRDVEGALRLWYLEGEDVPLNYAEDVKEHISRWANRAKKIEVKSVEYSGFVAQHQVEPMDWSDPRAEFASAIVQIDVDEVHFFIGRHDESWLIEAWAIGDYLNTEQQP